MGSGEQSTSRVLVVDPESSERLLIGGLLGEFYRVSFVDSAARATAVVEKQQVDLVLACASDAVGMARDIGNAAPNVPLLILSPRSSDTSQARELGAVEVLARDLLRSESGRANLLLHIERIVAGKRRACEKEFQRGRTRRTARNSANLLIGTSEAAARLRNEVKHAAATNLNLLMTGETGVGKSLVAECVHHESDPSGERPFVVLEPASLPVSLFESELFGHVRGAYTGAEGAQAGAFEAAQGGTLFLEEIGDLPAPLQVKLLRAVETKVIRRIGESRDVELSVRIMAATNRNLEADIDAGRFRADLFQRLNELRLHIPPLRERQKDVLPLLEHFLGELSPDRQKPCRVVPAAESLLAGYAWPGNVRELRTLARRLVQRGSVEEITLEVLIPLLPARVDRGGDSDLSPEARISVFSRRVYLDELSKHGFNIRETARALSMPYQTLHSRLRSLGLLEVLRERRDAIPD